ncbi:MAG: 4Fe-4S binding protein [Salinivirgaceae bacterium]|nr:4Fe-4S binding protein [Salinivirgaceae bacterium]
MTKQVLMCHCKSEHLSEHTQSEISNILADTQLSLVNIHDFCGVCADKKEAVKDLFSEDKNSLIIACHSRTVNSLLKFAGLNSEKVKVETLNARELSIDEIENRIADFSKNENSSQNIIELNNNSDWPSWFPILDYERCVGCGQCADFCLFGTYSKTDDKVWVENPHACKNNCPACARICPHTAIIFPKYKEGGAIAGSASIDEKLEQERRQSDMNEILGSDIYKTLAQRKVKRQRIIQNEARDKAMKEREDALKEIKNGKGNNPFGNIKLA